MVKHRASSYSFDELYAALQVEVAAKRVTRILGQGEQAGLEIYDYSRNCQYDAAWNEINTLARGLVLCPAEKRVVAFPFEKFFNYGEDSKAVIPALPFHATFKMDGSLGIVYFWKNQWWVNTRGSFTSSQAKWATEWLKGKTDNLIPGVTYLVEIIYPENRVVIAYTISTLVLLGAYNHQGVELAHEALQVTGQQTGLRVVETFECSDLAALLPLVKVFDLDKEGVVLRFANGYRLKVKADKYREVHRMISQVSPLAIWEQMLLNKNDILLLPEEYKKDYLRIRDILENQLKALLSDLHQAAAATKDLAPKEVAGVIAERKKDNPIYNFIFAYRKENFWADFEAVDLTKKSPVSITRKNIFDRIRPTANRLEGYEPSGALAAFSDEI